MKPKSSLIDGEKKDNQLRPLLLMNPASEFTRNKSNHIDYGREASLKVEP
jgi:hypothetical protein